MKKEEAVKLLESKGFKKEKYPIFDYDEQWYKRISGSDCSQNGRPPPMVVTISTINGYVALSISLRGGTASGDWTDIRFYAMELDRLEDLDTFQFLIERAWEGFN